MGLTGSHSEVFFLTVPETVLPDYDHDLTYADFTAVLEEHAEVNESSSDHAGRGTDAFGV